MNCILNFDNIRLDESLNLYFGPDLINTNVRACNQSGFYLKGYTLFRNQKKIRSNILALSKNVALDKNGKIYDLYDPGAKPIISIGHDYNKYHVQNFTDGFNINLNIRKQALFSILLAMKRLPIKVPKLVIYRILKFAY